MCPIYLFENVETGEIREVSYHMTEDKQYAGENGSEKTQWRRMWTKPRMATDSQKLDPFSSRDFIRATNKPDTLGSLWDRSKEWSLKRKEKEGVDPLQTEYYRQYAQKRGGKKHPRQTREENAKSLANKGIKIEWGDDD